MISNIFSTHSQRVKTAQEPLTLKIHINAIKLLSHIFIIHRSFEKLANANGPILQVLAAKS